MQRVFEGVINVSLHAFGAQLGLDTCSKSTFTEKCDTQTNKRSPNLPVLIAKRNFGNTGHKLTCFDQKKYHSSGPNWLFRWLDSHYISCQRQYVNFGSQASLCLGVSVNRSFYFNKVMMLHLFQAIVHTYHPRSLIRNFRLLISLNFTFI